MRQFSVVRVLAALLTAICLSLLAGCGGGGVTTNPVPAQIVLTPTTVSLNEGDVTTISAVAEDSSGSTIAADITFTSSNPNIATVSTGGSICGGVWDSSFIVCNATIGQAGVGQVTITASSGGVNATLTAYVHEKVDRVVVNAVYPMGNCNTMGQVVTTSASAFNTSDPGCSPTAPCDITSTVGPIAISSNDPTIVANSAGIEPTYSSATDTPTYQSGGTITGSSGQTCNLSNFTAGNASGIDPTYSLATNSPTYTSGGTITGNAGQTCSLSNFNGVTGATATVALTGTDTIASGTHLTITSEGSGGITPPTTATLGNGTATCSGTANVITALNTSVGLGFSVVGAAATVTLTGANTIAFGAHLNVTASGYGATTPPTTATLSNGSATCSGTANVHTALTSAGVFTAQNPGSTTVFGSVSGVNSVAVPYLTCPVASIMVHDANSSNTSFTLTVGGTQPLTADVFDTKGQYIKPSITWGSSATASVNVAKGTTGDNPATLTGVAPGTAYITASCSDPDCNKNVGAQYSLNVATAAVSGGTTTTVYAASSNSLSLVPISTSTNTAGTPITLPFPPTSIVVDPTGTTVYLGSASSGLMAVNVSTGVVTTYSVFGAIEAISLYGKYLLVSYPPLNSLYYFNASTLTTAFTQAGETTNSSAFTPDGKLNEWLNGSQLGVVIPAVSRFSATTLGYTGNALDISGQGGLTYITAATPNGIDVRSTCDQSEVLTLSANTPTLIKAIPNGTGAVAADSPAIDVVTTGTVQAGCPAAAPNSVASFDLGAGPFNARQVFFSSNSTGAWIVSDLPELLLFDLANSTPYTIPYAGSATAFSGGTTLDGTEVYVGTSDGTVHRIDVGSHTDAQQIVVGLKDGSGNPVAPNLVYVVP
ncbi:MAG: beta strand repeat-containing protein [Terriglobales bacterium]